MQRSVEPGEGLILPQLGEQNPSQDNNKRLVDQSRPKTREMKNLTAEMEKSLEVENKGTNNDLLDYTAHPLVLGPAYLFEDFTSRSVNLLDKKTSGVTVVGINKGVHFASRLRAAKLLTTFQVKFFVQKDSNVGTKTPCKIFGRYWVIRKYERLMRSLGEHLTLVGPTGRL